MFKRFRKRKRRNSSSSARSSDGSVWSEKFSSRVQNLVKTFQTRTSTLRRFKTIFSTGGSSDASFNEDAWDAGLEPPKEGEELKDDDDGGTEGGAECREVSVEQVKEYYTLTPPQQSDTSSSKGTMPVYVGTDKTKLHLELGPDDPTPRKSPVTVREWVDALPLPPDQSEEERHDAAAPNVPEEVPEFQLGEEAAELCTGCPTVIVADSRPDTERQGRPRGPTREPSVQSDVASHAGSHASSMESYLDSRRPDPEEILMGLGFGGCVGEMDTDMSRIPRRFLQPSKVKGVDIDDFLRHQQDLIETFESGFYGYRGLIGPSHTPSVIVAKIMEKLREHERENTSRESVISPSLPQTPPKTQPTAGKFSRVAHSVAKRASVASALSVLNPANRQFLDNQGGKSPEAPRKRMIIGQKSFTFGCDGDLVEVDPSMIVPSTPPPLLHKDSVLSSITTFSLTSMDSDTDSDDQRHDSSNKQGNFFASTPLNMSELNERDSSFLKDYVPTDLEKTDNLANTKDEISDSLTPDTDNAGEQTFPSSCLANEEACAQTCDSFPTALDCDDSDIKVNKESDDLEKLSISEANNVNAACTKDELSFDERYRRGSLKRQRHISDSDESFSPDDTIKSLRCEEERNSNLLQATADIKGDSFEIEEIQIPEDECGPKKFARMRSDSSGFLDFDGNERTSPDNNAPTISVTTEPNECVFESEIKAVKEYDSNKQNFHHLNVEKHDFHDTVKRQSLPLVYVLDEWGKLRSPHHSHSYEDLISILPQIKRSRSAPNSICISENNIESTIHNCNSFNDVFSFCSAESVICNDSGEFTHPRTNEAAEDDDDDIACSRSSSLTLPIRDFRTIDDDSSTKDLEELVQELSGVQGFDKNIPLQSDTQYLWLQNTLRLALELYKHRMARTQNACMVECVECPEVHEELQVLSQIREQIAVELRRIADLLDEDPPSKKLTAVTKQMTALLREQTRLCQLLKGESGATSHESCTCCRALNSVREETRNLQQAVKTNSQELSEIKRLLQDYLLRR